MTEGVNNIQINDRTLKARVLEIIISHHVISLSTTGPDGPHGANLFYAQDDMKLIWVSDPATRHSRFLEADSRVAATISNNCSDYSEIVGLQILGRAQCVVDERARTRLFERLETRHNFLKKLADAPAGLANAYSHAGVYLLTPSVITLTDNRLGFGHKEVLSINEKPNQ